MFELPAGSRVPRTDGANGNSDVQQAEVGGGRREPVPVPAQPAETRAGQVRWWRPGKPGWRRSPDCWRSRRRKRVPKAGPGPGPGPAQAWPRCGSSASVAPGRFRNDLPALAAPRSGAPPDRPARDAGAGSAAGEACAPAEPGSRDCAECQRNPPRTDFDILTLTVALTASEVIHPLIEKLGCGKFVYRE
ncbi:hypothetical protein HPG69_018029 [Diceros bicornis minor]|uniref:Uncharacterized protein n=1 Tax=Diceros bicornis minor TaxID=77932 RepID=A0A7J7F8T6_DICBM|nr:hypothetical protein HPG69_018029 [Diceros bicornis minor]